MSKLDLLKEARRFAEQLQQLVNGTVASSAHFGSVLDPEGSIGWVTNQPLKNAPWRGHPIPLTLVPGRRAKCYLSVAQTLTLDPEREHLTTKSATYGLHLDAAADKMIFHYDYVREPDNPYPGAHVQVAGSSASLKALCASLGIRKELKDFHFPVGGKRYRPSLEDMLEFLIVEGIAEPHPKWKTVLEGTRRTFHRLQLRAAVRRDPETALSELERLGLVED